MAKKLEVSVDEAQGGDLASLAKRVANYVLNKDHRRYENWENAVNAGGLICLDAELYSAKIKAIADYSVRMQASDGQLSFGLIVPGDPANVVQKWTGAGTITGTVHSSTVGPVVLHAYEKTKDELYLKAAERQYGYLNAVKRTQDGGVVHREEAAELWLDTVWFIVPFLAHYGKIAGSKEATDDAVRQIDVHLDRLLDAKTGLLRHIWCESPDSYPQSSFWSRGHGWVVAGLADTYELLPQGHSGRRSITKQLQALVPPLIARQDATGFWHNILDDRHSPLESTGTLMFAYGFKKALDLGILKGDEILNSARRGLEAAAQVVDVDGTVHLAALPPGGPGARVGVAPYGQGWFLQAAGRFVR